MKKLTMMAALTASTALFALDGSDAWIRQNLVNMNMNTGTYAPPPPMPEDRTMSYHVSNSSGSQIEALYVKGADSSSWSGNCLADSSARDWINTTTLYVGKSSRLHGSPTASMRSGGRQQDLNGNWWTAPDFMAVEVPLGGYDGYAYRMKVRWEDGTEREFHLPYPWGDVTIYKNQAKVYLGVSGRGLFYNNWIDAL